MRKVLLLVMIAITLSGCATNNGGSAWDDWASRLKNDTPPATRPADSQDWVNHNYGQ